MTFHLIKLEFINFWYIKVSDLCNKIFNCHVLHTRGQDNVIALF